MADQSSFNLHTIGTTIINGKQIKTSISKKEEINSNQPQFTSCFSHQLLSMVKNDEDSIAIAYFYT